MLASPEPIMSSARPPKPGGQPALRRTSLQFLGRGRVGLLPPLLGLLALLSRQRRVRERRFDVRAEFHVVPWLGEVAKRAGFVDGTLAVSKSAEPVRIMRTLCGWSSAKRRSAGAMPAAGRPARTARRRRSGCGS